MNAPEDETLHQFLDTAQPAALGPEGRPGTLGASEIRSQVDAWCSARAVRMPECQAVLALLLLWHDHQEASHTLWQGIGNAHGSFIHAIMHRREPDSGNSKYWWRQTGQHPAFTALGQRAVEYLRSINRRNLDITLVREATWRPDCFVDVCEAVAEHPANALEMMLYRELQRIEFEVLLNDLLQVSTGRE